MNKIYSYTLAICLCFFNLLIVKAQDVPLLQMSVGAASNVSLFSNKINNGGGYFSLEYMINRNFFAGIQFDYLLSKHNISVVNPSFGNGVVFPGDSVNLKEQITKMNAGIYGGYKFFPLSDVSINLALSASQYSLDRTIKDNGVLNEDAMIWYNKQWASNTAMVFGLSASLDFYLSKTSMLRVGANYQDFTNTLLADKDPNVIKEISYTDGRINSVVLYNKPYQSLDVFMALVFKFGFKKL